MVTNRGPDPNTTAHFLDFINCVTASDCTVQRKSSPVLLSTSIMLKLQQVLSTKQHCERSLGDELWIKTAASAVSSQLFFHKNVSNIYLFFSLSQRILSDVFCTRGRNCFPMQMKLIWFWFNINCCGFCSLSLSVSSEAGSLRKVGTTPMVHSAFRPMPAGTGPSSHTALNWISSGRRMANRWMEIFAILLKLGQRDWCDRTARGWQLITA